MSEERVIGEDSILPKLLSWHSRRAGDSIDCRSEVSCATLLKACQSL